MAGVLDRPPPEWLERTHQAADPLLVGQLGLGRLTDVIVLVDVGRARLALLPALLGYGSVVVPWDGGCFSYPSSVEVSAVSVVAGVVEEAQDAELEVLEGKSPGVSE